MEDTFKNLENILMAVDKNTFQMLEKPLEIEDEQLEKDIDYIHGERKSHRSSLIELIENLTKINEEQSQCDLQIQKLEEKSRK